MKLYNFRDLGGMPTTCNKKIRSGLLFRTGNVAHWSDEAAQHVASNCGVKLYIDFRVPAEVAKFGKPEALIRQKVEWMPISIETSDPVFEKIKLPKAQDWITLYQKLFENNITEWTKFASIVTSTTEPILYGCLFGKDRTGIASSVLLNLLDVHSNYIIADYAKTTDNIRPLSQLFENLLENHGQSEEELFEHFSRSHESVMFEFLEYLRTHPENHILGKQLSYLEENFREPLKARLLEKA